MFENIPRFASAKIFSNPFEKHRSVFNASIYLQRKLPGERVSVTKCRPFISPNFSTAINCQILRELGEISNISLNSHNSLFSTSYTPETIII